MGSKRGPSRHGFTIRIPRRGSGGEPARPQRLGPRSICSGPVTAGAHFAQRWRKWKASRTPRRQRAPQNRRLKMPPPPPPPLLRRRGSPRPSLGERSRRIEAPWRRGKHRGPSAGSSPASVTRAAGQPRDVLVDRPGQRREDHMGGPRLGRRWSRSPSEALPPSAHRAAPSPPPARRRRRCRQRATPVRWDRPPSPGHRSCACQSLPSRAATRGLPSWRAGGRSCGSELDATLCKRRGWWRRRHGRSQQRG